MQLVSNNSVIVSPDNDSEALQEAIEKIKVRLTSIKDDSDIEFKYRKKPFPGFVIPEGITFMDLKEACLPDITLSFKAIGDDTARIPGLMDKVIVRTFTDEEMLAKAKRMAALLAEIDQERQAAKDSAAKHKLEVNERETELSEIGGVYREGKEDVHRMCAMSLDFKNKKRIFVDNETGELLLEEEMRDADWQMRMNFNQGQFTGFTSEDDNDLSMLDFKDPNETKEPADLVSN